MCGILIKNYGNFRLQLLHFSPLWLRDRNDMMKYANPNGRIITSMASNSTQTKQPGCLRYSLISSMDGSASLTPFW